MVALATLARGSILSIGASLTTETATWAGVFRPFAPGWRAETGALRTISRASGTMWRGAETRCAGAWRGSWWHAWRRSGRHAGAHWRTHSGAHWRAHSGRAGGRATGTTPGTTPGTSGVSGGRPAVAGVLEALVPLLELGGCEDLFEGLAELFVLCGDLGFDVLLQGIQGGNRELVGFRSLLKLLIIEVQFIAQAVCEQLSLSAWRESGSWAGS